MRKPPRARKTAPGRTGFDRLAGETREKRIQNNNNNDYNMSIRLAGTTRVGDSDTRSDIVWEIERSRDRHARRAGEGKYWSWRRRIVRDNRFGHRAKGVARVRSDRRGPARRTRDGQL